MAANISTVSVSETVTAKALQATNNPYALYDLSGGYFGLLYLWGLINKPFGGWQTTNIADGFKTAFQQPAWVQAIVGSSSTVAGYQVVVLADSSYQGFRVGDIVTKDAGNIRGRVEKVENGVLYLMPVQGSTLAQLNATFTAGSWINCRYDLSATAQSGAKSSQVFTPNIDYNYTSVTRDAATYSHRDNNTKVLFLDDAMQGYRLYNDTITIKKFLSQYQDKLLTSDRSREVINGRQYDSNGGVEWAIKNRGGDWWLQTSPMTRSEFENRLAQTWNKRAGRKMPMFIFGGRSALTRIQSFYADPIYPSRILDQIAGSDVKGLNLKVIQVARMEFVLMDLDFLNDPQRFQQVSQIPGIEGTMQSNKFYVLDMENVESADGRGGILPACRLFHWEGTSPFNVAYIPGVFDGMGAQMDGLSARTIITQTKGASINVATPVDEGGWHIITDSGIDFATGYYSMLAELAF